MNPAHTVLRSNYSLVYICFSVTTNTRKKITQTEQMYLMHSCWNTLTLHFARVLSTKDFISHPSALLKNRHTYSCSYILQTRCDCRVHVRSKGDVSQELKADLAHSTTPFFPHFTSKAQLKGRVIVCAFASFGDLNLLAAGTGQAHRELNRIGAALCCCSAQLGIWVMASCSGCKPGLCLLKRG